jgi:hypothetical protein
MARDAFGGVWTEHAVRQEARARLYEAARAGRPMASPVPPPPDIAAPGTADPPPDDPTDTDAQLRWLLRQAHVGLAQAKPGTQAHTSALKACRELQEALAAHAAASSAPPPMDPADARAHLRDLAARLPMAELEIFALRWLAANLGAVRPELAERVKRAAQGLGVDVGTDGGDEGGVPSEEEIDP